MSASWPSPPSRPSAPQQITSYGPLRPGQLYWYGWPHGSTGSRVEDLVGELVGRLRQDGQAFLAGRVPAVRAVERVKAVDDRGDLLPCGVLLGLDEVSRATLIVTMPAKRPMITMTTMISTSEKAARRPRRWLKNIACLQDG